jgi:hypothetical protein
MHHHVKAVNTRYNLASAMHHILHDVMIVIIVFFIVLETAPLLRFTQLKELPTCRSCWLPKDSTVAVQ